MDKLREFKRVQKMLVPYDITSNARHDIVRSIKMNMFSEIASIHPENSAYHLLAFEVGTLEGYELERAINEVFMDGETYVYNGTPITREMAEEKIKNSYIVVRMHGYVEEKENVN